MPLYEMCEEIMLTVNHFVLIFFKLFNFGIIIALAGYLFKRYGLPMIEQGIREYRTYLEGLAYTHRSLKEEEIMVEQQIINDRKEQDFLKERLMRWRASVNDQNKQLIVEREERKKMLHTIIAVQQKQIMHQRLFTTMMPQVLMEAYRTLKTEAVDESVQYKIFDQALSTMHRNEEQ